MTKLTPVGDVPASAVITSTAILQALDYQGLKTYQRLLRLAGHNEDLSWDSWIHLSSKDCYWIEQSS